MSAHGRPPWTAPYLRWAGSKRGLLPKLIETAPVSYERYVEPFVGSGCLFFALRPQRAVLSDFNPDLINSYVQVRAHPRRVARDVAGISGDSTSYYLTRAEFAAERDPYRRAVQFIYLNRRCFNGVYRTNRGGVFNTPFGRNAGQVPPEWRFYRCSVALRSTELTCSDFRGTLARVGEGDFVYLDPPYQAPSRSTYGEYGYGSFGDVDLDDLIDLLRMAGAAGAKVMISYTAGSRLDQSLAGWHRQDFQTRRSVAGNSAKRGLGAPELLAWNYDDHGGTIGGKVTVGDPQ